MALRLDFDHRPECHSMGLAPDGGISICQLTCPNSSSLVGGIFYRQLAFAECRNADKLSMKPMQLFVLIIFVFLPSMETMN